KEKRYSEAEQYLKRVLSVYPDYAVALEQLALAYQEQGKLAEARECFDRGRQLMPYNRARYTVNIAVLEKMMNHSDKAKQELESIRDLLPTATDPDVLRAWWFLGELYREEGQTAAELKAYDNYLQATAGIADNADVQQIRSLIKQRR